jgi:hypothetical protein
MINFEQVEQLLEDYVIQFTEDQLNYLVENRIEFIKTSNKDKISTAHDPESEKMSSDKIVDTIASKIDPTTRKEHTQWLVNRYKAGDFKLSDAKDMKKLMTSYETGKSFLENKNLNDMKSVSHLRDSLAPVKARAEKKPEEDESPDETMPTIFEGEHGKGYKVPSKSTSIKNYGPAGKLAKTNWCTAAAGRSNMYTGYVGGKYTLHLDNGHIMQVNHQSNQLMDIQNKPVKLETDPRFSDHQDTVKAFLKKTHELEGKPQSGVMDRYVGKDPEELQRLIDEHKGAYAAVKADTNQHKWNSAREFKQADNALQVHLTSDGDVPDHIFDQLKSLGHHRETWSGDHIFSDSTDYTPLLANNKLIKQKHIDSIVEGYVKNPDSGVFNSEDNFKVALAHPKLSSDAAHMAIGHILSDKVSDSARSRLIDHMIDKSQNLKPEHFNRLVTSSGMKHYAVQSAHSSSTLPHEFLQHSLDNHGYAAVARRHEITPEMADKIAEVGDHAATSALAHNTNVPKETVFKAIDKARDAKLPIQHIIEREDFEPADVTKIVHGITDGRYQANTNGWRHSNKLSRSDIQHVLNHPNVNQHIDRYDYPITRNNRVRSDDLDTLLKNPAANSDKVAEAVVASSAVKPKHIDAALNMASPKVKDTIIGRLLDSEDTVHELATSGHLHDVLKSDTSIHNKHRVIAHPNVQLSHFEAVKDNHRFHGVISSSKNAPPSILHSLATSPMDHVRLNVAENPNSLNETRKLLSTDQDPEIAKIAARKMK